MDASDNSGFWFRNTSLTIRLRFTPAMACSTRTRSRANLRLAPFSAAVSARPRGFFFRLTGLQHRGLIPLKSGVFIEGGARRITQLLLIGDSLIVGRTGISPAEEHDVLIRSASQQHVLARVRLLLAAVVQGLFFGIFRPLPAPLRAVDDDSTSAFGLDGPSRQPSAVSLRRDAQVVQGRAEHGKEVMEPVIRLGRADAEELTQHDLERVRLQIDQDEQQLV